MNMGDRGDLKIGRRNADSLAPQVLEFDSGAIIEAQNAPCGEKIEHVNEALVVGHLLPDIGIAANQRQSTAGLFFKRHSRRCDFIRGQCFESLSKRDGLRRVVVLENRNVVRVEVQHGYSLGSCWRTWRLSSSRF